MTERPIRLTEAEIVAILATRQSQIRHPICLPGGYEHGEIFDCFNAETYVNLFADPGPGISIPFSSALGNVGDLLWVKEAWSPDFSQHYPCSPASYRAGFAEEIEVRNGVRGIWSPESKQFVPFRWRPATTMPRKFARLGLRIEKIRADRVQNMSNRDARNMGSLAISDTEGFYEKHFPKYFESLKRYSVRCLALGRPAGAPPPGPMPKEVMRAAWSATHGTDAWKVNAWVWVVDFRMVML